MRPLALLLALLPTSAEAGPWPQEEGRIYVLVSHQGEGDGWTGLYAEYGGPFGLTFGLDTGGRVVGLAELSRTGFTDRQTDGRVRSFVRIPVPLPGEPGDGTLLAPWLAAVELSLGRDFEEDGTTIDRYGVGATVGRGFSTRYGDGWTTLDLHAAFASEADTRTGLGFVAGIKPLPRLAVELGIYAERDGEDDPAYQIGPTVQYGFGRLGEGRLGMAYTSDGDTAVTLGWSRAF